MYRMAAGSVRLGAIALLAAVLVCGICCEGAAEAGERDSDQPRQAAARSQRLAAAPSVSPEHQSGLGPMRYYGGPKSPIWRAPVAN
jgi:hypothetical protein